MRNECWPDANDGQADRASGFCDLRQLRLGLEDLKGGTDPRPGKEDRSVRAAFEVSPDGSQIGGGGAGAEAQAAARAGLQARCRQVLGSAAAFLAIPSVLFQSASPYKTITRDHRIVQTSWYRYRREGRWGLVFLSKFAV